ncbi:TIGR03986 family CRISPR-associated RAMP protein [Thermopolyspora sp. NPDC052614]|uniref:TIGR03986 family type III CRISPR-associated RAMP protein n=1 Tax=Thermopolyspora sp. NPDC052614 TaxID=3155682 RepID=UPI0034306BA0
MSDAFLNPYTFIPAFPRQNLPEPLRDAAPPPRNQLRPEAWTGRIAVTLTTETPLLLLDTARYRSFGEGDGEGKPDHRVYPVRLRDGRPYLPVTTVKGMLRAAYEAITNSRFGVFEPHDERFGFRRDAGFALGMVPVYVGSGGRLFRLKMAHLRLYDRDGGALYPPDRMPRHRERIKALISGGRAGDRVVGFTRDLSEELPAGLGERTVTGIAYITGPNIEGKTAERFFFSEGSPPELGLARPWEELAADWNRLIENYRTAHDPKEYRERHHPDGRIAGPGERVGTGPGQLAWSPHLHDDTWLTLTPGSVCFARLVNGRVDRLYPVMVPRDLYPVTPADLLPADLKPAPTYHELSPADRLFGWVAPGGKQRVPPAAYRGRIRIGPVMCDDDASTAVRRFGDGLPLAILSTPKPQQGRFYLAESAARPDQPVRSGTAKADLYRRGRGLRGRKVYWHHAGLDAGQHWNPEVPGVDASQAMVGGRYREYLRPRTPVDDKGTLTGDKRRYATTGVAQRDSQNRSIEGWVTPGTTFRFTIEVRDVDDYELGALAWLLTLPEGCFHRLGFGRPLGFGSVRLSVDDAGVELHSGADYAAYYRTLAGELPGRDGVAILADARKRFEEVVESSPELRTVRDSMLAAARGRDLPVHYPRTRPEELRPGIPVPPDPRGENYKWFSENERLVKGNIAPGRGRSLPSVLGNDTPLDPYPEKAERSPRGANGGRKPKRSG